MHLAAALVLLCQAAAGQKTSVKLESTVELDIVVRDGNGETNRALNLMRRETYTQAKVDDKSFRIECLSSTLQKSGTDTPLEEKATALSGQTYKATRSGGGWIVEDLQGGAAPAEGQYLGSWNDAGKLLPASGAPEAGAKWTVEGRDLLALVAPASLRDGQGKLECVCESVEGGKAHVTFNGTITGKGGPDGTAAVTLTVKSGRLVYDTARNAPCSLMLNGSLESTMDMVERIRRTGSFDEEVRKVGEISLKSKKLEAVYQFE